MARYLVTGIAGFLGSAVARELVSRGESVRGLDNLSTGSLNNLAGIEDSIELLHADLRSANALDLACDGIDYIFHFAAVDSVQRSIEDPIGSSHVNLDGTLHLIGAAQAHNIKRIVFAGSAAIYGNTASNPISEDATPNPLSPYATQKLSCEQYLANAWTMSGIETVTLRYFNVFGPRQSSGFADSGVIAQLTSRMLSTDQGGPIIYGDGEQVRDFVFISDAVNAALAAMQAPAEAVAGKSFNIGNSRGKSIKIAFETIACMLGFTGDPRYVQARPLDVERSIADITAAREAFGYNPTISFADGLYKTVTWFRQQQATRTVKPIVERRRSERVIAPLVKTPGLAAGERHIDAHTFAAAVQNNELELFYQPILDLHQHRIVAVEALLRWRFGARLLTPAHFMHLAEQKGLTPAIGTWVLDTACAQLAQFHQELRPDLRLAINISAVQIEQPTLIRLVDSALNRANLAPAVLDLEVVERTLVRDCATTQQNLMQLRRRGIRISVDDFGTGYSNMNYLYRFPIDCIKIDQSFVQHRGHARVLNGIVAFARTLGVRTVAEGVESSYQLSHVTQVGCDQAQGFHIGRPVPPANLIPIIRSFEASIGAGESAPLNRLLPPPTLTEDPQAEIA
jgi:nucleoside-diphosphate-sugar epimerase/EAL domain-containing protein (putative c-di-GMP-specific phosphodiesterase class I)